MTLGRKKKKKSGEGSGINTWPPLALHKIAKFGSCDGFVSLKRRKTTHAHEQDILKIDIGGLCFSVSLEKQPKCLLKILDEEIQNANGWESPNCKNRGMIKTPESSSFAIM